MNRCSGLLLALGLLLSPPSHAHLLKVFAFAEGSRIEGSVYFAGGAPATGATIHVRSSDSQLLADLAPDSKGEFSYVAKDKMDHMIEANTGDGHVARWTVPAAELTGKVTTPDKSSTNSGAAPGALQGDSRPVSDELIPVIERAVAKQVRPLREQIIAYEERIRVRDVIGGLGYIAGLGGLAVWLKRRPGSTGK